MTEKKCFLISPIGNEGTDIRAYADNVYEFLKSEVFTEAGCEYHVIRSDEHATPHSITGTMIGDIIDSELVIAFLDGDNPNVYYEIAVRHAAAKPCLAIVSSEYRNAHAYPFDLQDMQQISFSKEAMEQYDVGQQTMDSKLRRFKRNLIRAVRACEVSGEGFVENPITRARTDFRLPPQMTTEDLIRQVIEAWRDDTNKELVAAIEEKVKFTNDIAEYIDGEEQAFERLAIITSTAQRSLRTSRFAPQAISGGSSDDYKTKFFNALCAFGLRPDVTCTRIMCMNDDKKYEDLWKTITGTHGGSMELYLTERSNNFELVVIDERYAFLHFYDDNENRRIKSTLFIKNPTVSREFERIYCHILEDEEYGFHVIKSADCDEPDQQAAAYAEAKSEFKKRRQKLLINSWSDRSVN